MLEIMKKGYVTIFLIAMLGASVLTEDMLNTQYMAVLWSALSDASLVLADGNVCGGIKICKTAPVGINFVNGNQRCRVEYRAIPPQLAEKYGYDPVKAAEFEKLLKRRELPAESCR